MPWPLFSSSNFAKSVAQGEDVTLPMKLPIAQNQVATDDTRSFHLCVALFLSVPTATRPDGHRASGKPHDEPRVEGDLTDRSASPSVDLPSTDQKGSRSRSVKGTTESGTTRRE